MPRAVKYSVVPVVVTLAAFFSLLPHTGGDATIRIRSQARTFAYAPDEVKVFRGARIAFVNETKTTHTATCTTPCTWDTGDIQPGQTKFIELPDDGTYSFVCRYHGRSHGLRGKVVVGTGRGPTPAAEPSPGPTGAPDATVRPPGTTGAPVPTEQPPTQGDEPPTPTP